MHKTQRSSAHATSRPSPSIQNRVFVNDFNKKVIVSTIKLMIRFVFVFYSVFFIANLVSIAT